MTYSQRWPLLADRSQENKMPYMLLSPLRLQEDIALGTHELSGQGLCCARLDMALCGLMQEFGEDFFWDEFFSSRFDAALELLLAAHVFLDQDLPRQQRQRVCQLLQEAESALTQWNQLLAQEDRQSLLFAAEEAALLP